ncbi:MAG: hypothetical protein V2B20_04110 [Pseudomonadota bacterium]
MKIVIAGIHLCFQCDDSWTHHQFEELFAYYQHNTDYICGQRHDIIFLHTAKLSSKTGKLQWSGTLADGTKITKSLLDNGSLSILIGHEVQAICQVDQHTTQIFITETVNAFKNKRPQPGGYLIPILQFILSCYGKYILHASAVSLRDRALLFLGESGCGKTTTSLALAKKGFSFMGDDLVILEAKDGRVNVHALLLKPKVIDESGHKKITDVISREKLNTCHYAELVALVIMHRKPGVSQPFEMLSRIEVLQWLLTQGNHVTFIFNGKDWFDTVSLISSFTRGWTWTPGLPETLNLDMIEGVLHGIA